MPAASPSKHIRRAAHAAPTGPRRRWALAVALAGVFALIGGACTDTGAETEPAATRPPTAAPPTAAPATTAPTTQQQPPTTTTSTTDPAALVDIDAVDDLADWKVVAGPDELLQPPALFDGRNVVVTRPPEESLSVLGTDGGERVVHHPPRGDTEWLVDDAGLSAGHLVVTQHEEVDGDFEVWAYDLGDDDAAVLLDKWPGEPLVHVIPQVSVEGARVAWNRSNPDGTTCVRVRDLATGEHFDAVCSAGPEEVLGWPILSWPTLTYRTATTTGETCVTLFSKQLPDGPATPLPSRRPCRSFQGASVGGTSVWFEMPPESSNASRTSILGAGQDGTLHDLGVGSAGSARVCGGRIYWVSELGDHNEIRTWAAGEPLRVLYRSPEDKFPTTSPKCADGWLTIARSFTGVGPLTLDVLTISVG